MICKNCNNLTGKQLFQLIVKYTRDGKEDIYEYDGQSMTEALNNIIESYFENDESDESSDESSEESDGYEVMESDPENTPSDEDNDDY